MTLIAIESPLELAVVTGSVLLKLAKRECHVPHARRELTSGHLGHRRIISRAVDRLPFHYVTGPEEHHEVFKIADLLLWIVDRHRSDPEHLIAACSADRIDATEAAAMPDCQLRRIGARPQIFRHLDLMLAINHLVEERQAGDEAHHRNEPWRAGMGLYETIDAAKVVYTYRVFDIRAPRILMSLPEAHERLPRPRIVVKDRNFYDTCLQNGITLLRTSLQLLQLGEEIISLDGIGIELDLERSVGGADLRNAVNLGIAHRVCHGEALEEGFERHLLIHLDEDVLVTAIGISGLHRATTSFVALPLASLKSAAFSSNQRSNHRVSNRPASTSASQASAMCSRLVVCTPTISSSPSARCKRRMALARSPSQTISLPSNES